MLNWFKRKRAAQIPTVTQVEIGELQVDSGTLLLADPMYLDHPVSVEGIPPGRYQVCAQIIRYPEGGQRVARVGMNVRTGNVEARRTIREIAVDSGMIVAVDALACKTHWKEVGPERIGRTGTPGEHRRVARLIAKEFGLKSREVNFLHSVLEKPVSEGLETGRQLLEARWFAALRALRGNLCSHECPVRLQTEANPWNSPCGRRVSTSGGCKIREQLVRRGRIVNSRALLGCCLLALAQASNAFSLGGTLDHPSIAIPATGEELNGQREAVENRLYLVLVDHKAKFVIGHFVNARSTLYFSGTAEDLSKLLADLAAVKGAVLSVRFSNARGEAASPFAKDVPASPSQWEIEHDGWSAAPRKLTITVYLGDGKIDMERLALPEIVGRERVPR